MKEFCHTMLHRTQLHETISKDGLADSNNNTAPAEDDEEPVREKHITTMQWQSNKADIYLMEESDL